jgi:quercetin dioxygenase-like cupin family protein
VSSYDSTTPHFTLEGAKNPTSTGRFVDIAAIDPVRVVPGLDFRPVIGEDLLVNHVTYEPHSVAPLHVHAEEQHIMVISGVLHVTIDGETRTMTAGDYCVIPSWVPHGAETHDEPCVEIDIFTPPRATMVDHARRSIPSSTVDGTRPDGGSHA